MFIYKKSILVHAQPLVILFITEKDLACIITKLFVIPVNQFNFVTGKEIMSRLSVVFEMYDVLLTTNKHEIQTYLKTFW